MPPPYSFRENSFTNVPLGRDVDPGLQRLVVRLRQGQAFFLTGAGLSAGPPTGLPTGPGLAKYLREWATVEGLGGRLVGLQDPDDLGEVATVLEAVVGRDAVVSCLLRAVSWRGRHFNLGHLVLALLFAEQLLESSFTANWDSCVLDAGETISGLFLSCPCDIPSLRAARSPKFVHIHGRAEAPGTLVIRNEDLDEPQAMAWSQPQLAAAITTADAAIVGFAAEPAYVVRTIEEMLATMGNSPAAVIDRQDESEFATQSPRLAAALGVGRQGSPYVNGSATECLGEVARGCYGAAVRELLDRAEQRATDLVEAPLNLDPAIVEEVRTLLTSQSLARFLEMLWRAAQLADEAVALQPTLVRTRVDLEAIVAAVMIMGSCADVTSVVGTQDGICLVRAAGDVDLWPVIPETRISVTTAVRRAVAGSRRFTRPGSTAHKLMLICAGTDGAVPPGGHPALLAGGAPGALTQTTRVPDAVATLDEIHRRLCTLGSTLRTPMLADLVPLP